MQLTKRSDEIDFLRGIAVMLVLFSHHFIFLPLNRMGWIGVDLFFVLSGFLVSGLLFTEYKKYGNIRPRLFLIRRGFKIYPLFYFSILITVLLLLLFPNAYVHPESRTLFLNDKGIITGAIIEVLFLQSFFFGFWGHHWSLSIEEFFYFLLALFLFVIIKKKKLENHKLFLRISLLLFFTCFLLRIISNVVAPASILTFTAAPLRIDSLFAGVLISYFYHFRYEQLFIFYITYKKFIWALIILLLAYTPFYNVLGSFFIKTIGFTFIYISFSLLLLTFLFEKKIVERVRKIITPLLFKGITKVGFYSYSIYLFHMYLIRFIFGENYAYQQYLLGNYTYFNVLLSFIAYFFGSILLGIGMSYLIEMPMLKIRDKYFPRRSGNIAQHEELKELHKSAILVVKKSNE